jgi:hypothetical protein
VVLVAGHAADPVAGELTAAQDSRPHPLDAGALAGAMLAQSALASAVSGAAHDRTIALADGAVDAWRDGATPLAVRAFVARVRGTAGESASQDLASAIALRDDAAFHLLRARLALATGDFPTAAAESAAAQSRARAWGDAALAAASVPRAPGGDAGEPCAPLAAAHEPWTDDALVLCRRAPAELVPAAAERLANGTHDPLRLAWAAAAGAPSAQGRVRARDRGEFAAWLALLGRPDLAGAAAPGGAAGP